jgi:hypothetical protein
LYSSFRIAKGVSSAHNIRLSTLMEIGSEYFDVSGE